MRRGSLRRALWTRALVLVIAAGGGGAAVVAANASTPRYATTPTSSQPVNPKAIPLGDGYLSSTPKVGYVDSCMSQFGGGGAQAEGPWINDSSKTWNSTTKVAVQGAVSWPSASISVKKVGNRRVIKGNDLPFNHTTGTFPVSNSDPAYQYDRNPNRIAAQTIDWSLPLNPTAASKPTCTPGGAIGILSDGVVLYNALDGQGRDAAAHEVLDSCDGHPDQGDRYHHHDIPRCILNKAPKGKSTLVGYALDGYGIYVVKSASGTLPSNPALDACHGTTSTVPWNGKQTRIYHYVATLVYPYTVGCFHGTPIGTAQGGP